uniref:Uncharacterized protein n=1 Tax=Anguilla anguilla TaxID=7936 RepID=A0A0E9VXA0_ANGAN
MGPCPHHCGGGMGPDTTCAMPVGCITR